MDKVSPDSILDQIDPTSTSPDNTSTPVQTRTSPDDVLKQVDGFSEKPNFPVTEVRTPLVKSLSRNFYGGLLDANSGINRLLGLGASKWTKDIFVTPGEEESQKISKETKSDNPVFQFANDFSRSLGSLAEEFPAQIMLGVAGKMALAGRLSPQIGAYLSKIPDFALGMGIERGVTESEKGKEPLLPALESTAIGLVYGKIGGEGKLAETAEQAIKRHLTAIPKLSAVGMAEAVYEALKAGRSPKTEEIAKGAIMGAAYGVLFAVLPVLREASDISVRTPIDKLQATMQRVMDGHHGNEGMEIKGQLADKGLKIQYGKKEYPIDSVQQASDKWNDLRDIAMKEGVTSKEADTPLIKDASGKTVGYISWNGVVWKGEPGVGKRVEWKSAEEKKGTDAIKQDIQEVMNHPDIPEQTKDVISTITSHEMSEDPHTGEQVPSKALDEKTPYNNLKNIVGNYFREKNKTKTLEFDANKLRTQQTADQIMAKRVLKELGISYKDAEAILHYDESQNVHKGEDLPPLTPDQKKVYDNVLQPLKQAVNALYEELGSDAPPRDESAGLISRNALGFGGLWDKMQAGRDVGNPSGNFLKVKSGAMRRRKMKVLVGEDGERLVVAIAGHVTSFKNGVKEDLGNFSLDKNMDVLKSEIRPYEDTMRNLKRQKRTLESVRTREPVSKNKIKALQEKMSNLQTAMQDPEGKIQKEFKSEIDKINQDLEKLAEKEKTLKPFEKDAERIKKAIEDIHSKSDELYEKEANLALSDIYERTSDFVKKHGANLDDAKNLSALRDIQRELKTLEKVKSSDDLVLRKRRIDTINRKMEEAQETINSLISRYELGNLNDKVFIDKNDKKWTVGDATIREIEKHSDVRYYKDPVHTLLVTELELKSRLRARQFLENFKNDPEFDKIGYDTKAGGMPPEGWERTKLKQFPNHYFDPRVADALDLIADKIQKGSDPSKLFAATNKFLRTAIFFNMFIHTPNIAVHWAVNRGVTKWFEPKSYGNLGETSARASEAVFKFNDDYVEMLASGVNLLYESHAGETLQDMLRSRMKEEMLNNKGTFGKVSEALGYANPVEWAKAWWKLSAKVTWFTNDFATMQAIYEDMANGKTRDEAIADVGKHIPNYVLPSRILDRKDIAQLMSNPNITMFGAYHYGALKSYGEMMKSIISGTGKERAEAFDKIAALAAIQFVGYPQMDKFAQWVTGNKHAHFKRAGATTFIDNVIKKFEGKIGYAQLLQSVATESAGLKFVESLYHNKDMFTGKALIDDFQDILEFAKTSVAPAALVQKIQQGKSTVEKSAAGFFGVSFTDPNAQKFIGMQQSTRHMAERLRTKLQENPQDKKTIQSQVESFNEKQKKTFDKMLSENEKLTGVKIPSQARKKMLQKIQIGQVSAFKGRGGPMTLEDYASETKPVSKVKVKKNITRTPEEESMIDKIMENFK